MIAVAGQFVGLFAVFCTGLTAPTHDLSCTTSESQNEIFNKL